MPRRMRLPLVLCTLALSLGLADAAAGAGAGAGPSASAAAACQTATVPSLGSGYFQYLMVKGVGCSTGRAVTVAWQACRLAHGGLSGRCHAKVVGFTCKELRQTNPPLLFQAKVTCKKGRASVVYAYEQTLR
jgi:hypothetical protein